MPRGRKPQSPIRQNIIDMLFFLKEAYGYDLYRNYITIFPKVTMRSIYYHLKKGLDLGEIKISRIQKSQGDYSWGSEAEKIYYGLGENAKPTGNLQVKKVLDKP